jgi:hypothetical protein
MEMRKTPIHNIIPTARKISKTTCLHSSPPNPAAKAVAKKNMLSALNATIAEKTVQITIKTPQDSFCFVVRASLNTSQQRKECLGIAIENQTNLQQATSRSFFLRLSQMSTHE